MKYKLESLFGEFFIYVSYIVGIGYVGFLLYSIIMQTFDAIIVCSLLIVFWYIFIISKIRKFKTVTFDEKFLYVEDKFHSFSNVKSISSGKIKLFENEKEETIFYNDFLQDNFDLLLKYYKLQTH